MRRGLTIAVGILSVLPILYVVYFFVIVISSVIAAGGSGPRDLAAEQASFDRLVRLHIGTMGLMVGLLIFYITYLFRTAHVPQPKKALWAVVLFLGSFIAMPVFWYHYMWKPAALGGKTHADL